MSHKLLALRFGFRIRYRCCTSPHISKMQVAQSCRKQVLRHARRGAFVDFDNFDSAYSRRTFSNTNVIDLRVPHQLTCFAWTTLSRQSCKHSCCATGDSSDRDKQPASEYEFRLLARRNLAASKCSPCGRDTYCGRPSDLTARDEIRNLSRCRDSRNIYKATSSASHVCALKIRTQPRC